MAALDFDKIKQDFINADVDEKIRTVSYTHLTLPTKHWV